MHVYTYMYHLPFNSTAANMTNVIVQGMLRNGVYFVSLTVPPPTVTITSTPNSTSYTALC